MRAHLGQPRVTAHCFAALTVSGMPNLACKGRDEEDGVSLPSADLRPLSAVARLLHPSPSQVCVHGHALPVQGAEMESDVEGKWKHHAPSSFSSHQDLLLSNARPPARYDLS